MPSAKDAIDRLRWDPGFSGRCATVWFEDRSSESGEACLSLSDIRFFSASFFGVDDANIPYHRVFRVESGGRAIFDRPARPAQKSRRRRARPGMRR